MENSALYIKKLLDAALYTHAWQLDEILYTHAWHLDVALHPREMPLCSTHQPARLRTTKYARGSVRLPEGIFPGWEATSLRGHIKHII